MPPPTPTPAPPAAPAAPAAAVSADQGRRLNDQAFRLMNAGRFDAALPLLQLAVPALEGVGPDDPYEAYASYNLGFTLLQLGRCDEAIPLLEHSDELQDDRRLDRALDAAYSCADGTASAAPGDQGPGDFDGGESDDD